MITFTPEELAGIGKAVAFTAADPYADAATRTLMHRIHVKLAKALGWSERLMVGARARDVVESVPRQIGADVEGILRNAAAAVDSERRATERAVVALRERMAVLPPTRR